MKAVRIYQRLQSYQPTVSVVVAPLLLLVMAGVYGLVYSTGGIKYVFSHSMYLPILIAGLIYR
ncbi:hypothetical protein ASE07_08755 [Noviherbaspirillum sp. Root189]|nr:hypothetical protein ASE07_08755 [Noviherbaspirillum sp. Root189]